MATKSVRLSDTLSARSYLDPGLVQRQSDPEGHERHERHGQDRSSRKRGRPRLDSTERIQKDRRSQVRRAQRTYRLKKETTIQSLRGRVTDLETLLQNISDILMNFQNAVSSDLDHTPILRETVDRLLAEINSSLPSSTSRDSQKGLPKLSTRHERFLKPMNPVDRRLLHMFGYQVSHQLEDEACEVEAEYPEPLHVSQPPFAQSTLQESRADPRVIICLGLVRWLAERNYSDQDLKEALQRMMESMLGLEDETDGDVDWLDCHDIGDYLAGLKITLDKSSILVDIPIETVALLEDTTDGDSGHPEYFLDVEHFLTILLEHVYFTSDTPRFQKTEVNEALRQALRKRP